MSKLLGPPKSYLELLDEHLVNKSAEESTAARRYNPLRPSAAGKCSAELATEYAQYKGLLPVKQEQHPPELQRIFGLGHSIEYMMIKSLRESGLFNIRYTQQVVRFLQLPDGKWLEGSLDLAISHGEHMAVADWKSKKDRLSSFGHTGWDEANEGYEKMQTVQRITDGLFWIADLPAFLEELHDPFLAPNFLQLNLYAMTNFIRESGIDHCSLFYFNKNDCRLREMRFKPSEEIYEQTKAKFLNVHNQVTASNAESVVETLRQMRCSPGSLCRYCWPDEAKRAYFSTLPPKKWPKDLSYLGADGKRLSELFHGYEELKTHEEHAGSIEQAILKILVDKDETKVRLENGNVYEAKFLKSPRPHHELRRSK
jgi:hypothetical protein